MLSHKNTYYIIIKFLIVPFAYIYISLVILRELCNKFPETIYIPIQYYTPVISYIIIKMNNISLFVEIWCYIEVIFYICLKLQIKYLNSLDPLETSLNSAPIMSINNRLILWNRMMYVEYKHPISFISGWFFDQNIENISKYDIRDFITWSMFESRHQEHLTINELRQLENFVKDLEERITYELYGNNTTNNNTTNTNTTKNNNNNRNINTATNNNNSTTLKNTKLKKKNNNNNNNKRINTTANKENTNTVNKLKNDSHLMQKKSSSTNNNNNNNNRISSNKEIYEDETEYEDTNQFEQDDDDDICNEQQENNNSNDEIKSKSLLRHVSDVSHDITTAQSADTVSTQNSSYTPSIASNTVHNVNNNNTNTNTNSTAKTVNNNNNNNNNNKRIFRFREEIQHEEPNFFSNLFESYKNAFNTMRDIHPPSIQDLKNMVNHAGDLVSTVAPVQEIRNMVNHAANEMNDLVNNVGPVQELRNMVNHAAIEMSEFMVETSKNLEKAEVSAIATASHMYESLIPSGSIMDKRLSAMSHATFKQLIDAWNSVKNIRERLETARYLSKQRQSIKQQLKGYRIMLNQMCEMSSAVPSKQMAHMMRRVTECNERMELLEGTARAAFVSATGFTLKNIPGFSRQEPQRYAKYSSDPLLGVATYPLGFHLFVLGCTEIPLRILMKNRGFERRSIGSINYYFHPGKDDDKLDNNDHDEISDLEDDLLSNISKNSIDDDLDDDDRPLPLVFVHGIGVGLLPYMPMIDALLKSGRPIFLPEIPYVSGFRPWQNPNGVLQPAVVTSTMTAMLATHGYLRATWLGHSYGTTWLSYMCKYASTTVAAIVFLDPICFGLHIPFLAKQFVYSRPDPGTVAYIIRTDVIVNWTIQRSFPWAYIALFLEELNNKPCFIYLSENDALVPATKIRQYFEDNNISITNFCTKQNKKLDIIQDDNSNENGELEEFSETNNEIDENDDVTVSNRCNTNAAILSMNNNQNINDKNKNTNESNHEHSNINQKNNNNNIHCIMFRGDGHGDWTERSASVSASISNAAIDLCKQVEENDRVRRTSTTNNNIHIFDFNSKIKNSPKYDKNK